MTPTLPVVGDRRPLAGAAAPGDDPDEAEAAWSAACVDRIRAGDAAAFGVMVEMYHGPLCAYVLRFVRLRALAEEVVQEVFLNVWARRQRWTAPRGMRAYLYAAARNRALNHLRRERTARQATESGALRPADGPPHADAALHERELAAGIALAIAALPARCREVFLLQRRRGLTYGEIARELGVSVKTVETQMSRALRALRLALAPYR